MKRMEYYPNVPPATKHLTDPSTIQLRKRLIEDEDLRTLDCS
jgi:hypothetical protein